MRLRPLAPVAQVRTRLRKAEKQQAELRRALADVQASVAQAADMVEEAEAVAVARGNEWYHLAEQDPRARPPGTTPGHDPRDLAKYGLSSELVCAEGPIAIIA